MRGSAGVDPASHAVVARVPTGASPQIASLFHGTGLGVAVVQGPRELLPFLGTLDVPVARCPRFLPRLYVAGKLPAVGDSKWP